MNERALELITIRTDARASAWSYLLPGLGLPVLWAANAGMVAYALVTDASLEVIPFISLVFNSVYLVLFERLLAYRDEWQPSAREWLGGAGYFAINMAASLGVQAGLAGLAIWLAPSRSALPLWLDGPLALLSSTFAAYWAHRWLHEHPWGWKIHSVHHNPRKQSMWFANYAHFIEIGLAGMCIQVPMLLLGSSAETVFLVNIFLGLQSYATHSNADLRIGWLNHVLGSPEQHRLHHSQALEEAGNYGGFIPLWDQLFGTFTWRPGREPERVGIEDSDLPPPESVLRNMLHPFR